MQRPWERYGQQPNVIRGPNREPTPQTGEQAEADRLGNEATSLIIEERRRGLEAPTLTPAQQAVDTAFASEYVEWRANGGSADFSRQLDQLRGIRDRLRNGEDLTGLGIGNTPDIVGSFTNPSAIDAREQVEEVVQRNLRLILGAQFTEREGERLISRAYNPRLDESVNADRLDRLIRSMEQAGRMRDEASDYYETNGSLVGWNGSMPNIETIETGFDEVAPQGGGTTPTGPAGAPREGEDSIDYMYRLREAGHTNESIRTALTEHFPDEGFLSPSNEAPQEEESAMGLGDVFAAVGGPGAAMGAHIAGLPAMTPAGVMSTNLGNALTGNLIGYLSDSNESLRATSERAPGAALTGQIAGSLVPFLGVENMAANLGTRLAPGIANSSNIAARGTRFGGRIGTDASAGAALANFAGESPGIGALGGGLGRAGGELAGRGVSAFIGRRRPALENFGVPSGRERVVDTLANDGLTPMQGVDQMIGGQGRGVPLILGDSGASSRGRLGAYLSDPQTRNAAGGDFLTARQAGQGDRVRASIERNLGPIPNNIIRAGDELTQQGRAASAGLYDDAYQGRDVFSPEIEDLLNTPVGRQAVGRARERSANRQSDFNSMGIDLDDQGQIILRDTPSMESLDHIKRAMDDIIEGSRDPVTGRLPTSGPIADASAVRTQYVAAIDRRNPVYAEARAAYAGPARDRTALEAGQRAARPQQGVDQLDVQLDRMSASERAQFQAGHRYGLADRTSRQVDGGDRVNNLRGSQTRRDQLDLVYGGSPGLRTFNQTMDDEAAAYATYFRSPQNSRQSLTDPRAAERQAVGQSNITNDDVGAVGAFGRGIAQGGELVSGLTSLGMWGARRANAGSRNAFNAEREAAEALARETEARILSARLPDEARGLLRGARRRDAELRQGLGIMLRRQRIAKGLGLPGAAVGHGGLLALN